MWWFASIALAIAEDPREVAIGEIAAVGERIGAAHVIRIDAHPEFERYWVGSEKGVLPAELTTADPDHEGLCGARGLVIYPRYELGSGAMDDIDLSPLCDRLANSTAQLRSRGAVEGAPVAMRADGVGRGLMGLGTIGLVAAFCTMRHWRPRAVGIFAAALALRMVLAEPGIFNGGGAAYEKLGIGLGWEWGTPYGPGFAVVMAPFVALLGAVPTTIFAGNLILAAMAPALLYVVVRRFGRVSQSEAPAIAAAFAAAIMPVHVALSRTEAMHVSVTTLFLAAVAAASAGVAGALVTLASTAILVATRPEALPLLLVPAALLWRNPSAARLPALAGVVCIFFVRILTLPVTNGVLQPSAMLDADTLARALLPRIGPAVAERAFQLFFHAAFTPPAWWALAVVGLLACPRPARWFAIATIGLGSSLFVTKVWPLADAVRLQVTAQFGWLVLVGFGVVALRRWGWIILVIGALPYLREPVARFGQAEEYRFLAAQVPRLASDARVRFDSAAPHGEKFRLIMEVLGPARWSDSTDTTILYHGLTCITDAAAPACVRTACPMATVVISGPSDVDIILPANGYEIGFYRVCP